MKRELSLLLILSIAMGGVTGCGNNNLHFTNSALKEDGTEVEQSTDSQTEASRKDKLTVGFAQVGHESDWRDANTQDYIDVFGTNSGYELSVVDCNNDDEVQKQAVQSFIEQKLDYIVIAPIETTGWDKVLKEAKEAEIPVIIADREIKANDSLYTAWIGTNTKAEGMKAANWLAEYLNGEEANILVIEGSSGASATIGRSSGFKEIADAHNEWKILDTKSGDFTQEGGEEVMESFVEEYRDQFNVVVCQNDNEAYGAINVLQAEGITYGVDGEVIVISFDATHDGLQYTLNGKINCDIECNPIQAYDVLNVMQAMEKGISYEKKTYVNDEAFVAPGIESQYATTVTEEVLASRVY